MISFFGRSVKKTRRAKRYNTAKLKLRFERSKKELFTKFTSKTYAGNLATWLYSKSALKCNDEMTSRYQGINNWMDINSSTRLIVWLGSQGYKIEQYRLVCSIVQFLSPDKRG